MTPLIGVEMRFEAAHRLQHHEGKCKNIHGHSYRLQLVLFSPIMDTVTGMVADFGEVKPRVKYWIDEHFDHALIMQHNDPVLNALATVADPLKVYIMPDPPTVENMVMLIARKIGVVMPHPVRVYEATLHETETCWASWRPT